jgi:copper(I)-binding protein
MTLSFRILVCSCLWGGAAAAAEPPAVSQAWIRATPPGARTAAAYMTITSTAAERLVGAEAAPARAVEIHTHVVEGGLQRMARLADLTLPAGEAVRLEPGGLHLMLVDLAAALAPGMQVSMTLRFAGAGAVEVEVPVVDARAAAPATRAGH